jgi:hypothetical protein
VEAKQLDDGIDDTLVSYSLSCALQRGLRIAEALDFQFQCVREDADEAIIIRWLSAKVCLPLLSRKENRLRWSSTPYRSAELPEEDADIRRGIGTAQTDLSSDPAHDCNAGAKERNTKDIQAVLRHSRLSTTTDVRAGDSRQR